MKVMEVSRLSLGDETFGDWVRELYTDLTQKRKRREDVALRRVAISTTVEQVLAAVADEMGYTVEVIRRRRRDSLARPVAVRMLCRIAGKTRKGVS